MVSANFGFLNSGFLQLRSSDVDHRTGFKCQDFNKTQTRFERACFNCKYKRVYNTTVSSELTLPTRREQTTSYDVKPNLHIAATSFSLELSPSLALQVAAKTTQHQSVLEQFTLWLNELLLIS